MKCGEGGVDLDLGDEMWEGWCGSGFYLEEEALKFQKYFPYFKSY